MSENKKPIKKAAAKPIKKAAAKPIKKAAAPKAATKAVVRSIFDEISEKPIDHAPVVENKREKFVDRMNLESSELKIDYPDFKKSPEAIIRRLRYQLPILTLVTIILTSVFTFVVTKQLETEAVIETSFAAKVSGGVALTESELTTVVKELGETVYWTGPMKETKYTINASTPGQVYIRYLPKGEGVNDTSAKYRIIGTYKEVNAYSSTLAAGNEANGVSFVTPEGSVVHYNKSAQGNVYVAFQNMDFQIEVFDPSPETALILATTLNQIKVIK